jgi:hypothetical protein
MRFSFQQRRLLAASAAALVAVGLAARLDVSFVGRALAAPVTAAHTIRADRQDTPQATVRDFLAAAVVDRDGDAAAAYLSPRARLSYQGHSTAGPDDAQFFADAHLTLGGLNVQSNAQLKQLSYTLLQAGKQPAVWVSHGDQGMLFALAPASTTDRSEFRGPQTPWRIESGVAALA